MYTNKLTFINYSYHSDTYTEPYYQLSIVKKNIPKLGDK